MVNDGSSRIFILDTSVILEDPQCFDSLASNNNIVILHPVVITELNRLKNGSGQKNYNARAVLRFLEELSRGGPLTGDIKLDSGGKIRIDNREASGKTLFDLGPHDNAIVFLAKALHDELDQKKDSVGAKVTLITLDNAMSIAARCLGVNVEDLKTLKVDIGELYKNKGFRHANFLAVTIDRIKEEKGISVKEIEDQLEGGELLNNEFVVPNNNYSLILRHQDNFLRVIEPSKSVLSIKPKPNNLPQHFAWNILFDESVGIVMILGLAGTGKTFLTLLAAMGQLRGFLDDGRKKLYDNIIVLTPTVSVGKDHDLGFLPGDNFEKISPWVQAIFDNAKAISRSNFNISSSQDGNNMESLRKKGILEFLSVNHIRGRNLSDSFVIVDEAQNFTRGEIKLIGTRAADGTKIVFTGDPTQVNRAYLNKENNGLVHAVKAFQGMKEAASIFLDRIVRSRVAELFATKF